MDNQSWNQQSNQNYGGNQYNQQNIGQQNWNQQQNYGGQYQQQGQNMGMNQQNWNQQGNMYNQPQTPYNNQYGQQNMYNQNMYNQNMYNQNMYNNANTVKKSGKKLVTFIVLGVLAFIIGFIILVVSLLGAANKERDAIKDYKVADALDEANIDYEEYDAEGLLYGYGVSFENDDLCIEIIECDSEEEAKKEFNASEDYVNDIAEEEDIEFNFTKTLNGKNYSISSQYSSEVETGAYLVRVDDTVIYSFASDENSWEDLKDIMDSLGY